jgi:hypothetical protein
LKISGCTYLREGVKLGYPFVESIQSALPLVDEFIVALGDCDDGTEERLRAIGDPKLRIINTQWNVNMGPPQHSKELRGFVYGQQRSMALFNCTGDWALYLDADELLHEQDLEVIRGAMLKYLDDRDVEALVFDYLHFYGNQNTIAWSPRWYKRAARIVRNTIPFWTPKGMAFIIKETQKRGRYPRAAHSGATIFHYGWMRPEHQMRAKQDAVSAFGRDKSAVKSYAEIDHTSLRPFSGTHPCVIAAWLPPAEGPFQANPAHRLTSRERRHRLAGLLEDRFGLSFEKKHYKLVR